MTHCIDCGASIPDNENCGCYAGSVPSRAAPLSAAEPAIPALQPVLWALYDSRGFYEIRETEEQAKRFCDHYNQQRTVDPLKPYTYKPLYTHPAPTLTQGATIAAGAVYAEMGYEHQRAIMEGERNASLENHAKGLPMHMNPSECRAYDAGFSNGWDRRASHGQAPAGAAPVNPHWDYLKRYWQMGFDGTSLGACTGDAPIKAWHEGRAASESMTTPSPQAAQQAPAGATDPWQQHMASQAEVIDCEALQRAMVQHGISFPEGGMEYFRASLGEMVNRFVRFAAPAAPSTPASPTIEGESNG